MPLLDLPPEVFGHVVHELIDVAGINGAWKLRGVCRECKAGGFSDCECELIDQRYLPICYNARHLHQSNS